MNNNTSKILLVPLVLVLGLLSFTGVSAALSFTGLPDVTFNEDTTSTLNLNTYVSGANGTVTFTYSGNTNVKVNINNGVATFSANANVNVPNGETITFTATDQTPEQKQDSIVVKINAVNDAPTITLTDSIKLEIDTPYSAAVTVTDVDDNTFTFSATTSWEAFKIDANNGQMSFTPTEDDFGPHKVTITVQDNGGGTSTKLTATKEVTFLVTEAEDDGSLQVYDLSVDDKTGDDDNTAPGDVLSINFDLKNKISKDIDDIEIEAWLQDSSGDRLGDKYEHEDTYDLEAKDSQSVKFEMQVDPEAEAGTYNLIIWAQGEDEDGNTKSVLATEEVTIKKESHDLYIESVAVTPNPAICGMPAEFSVNVWNVGKNDEDGVTITAKNTDLKIDSAVRTSIDKSDNEVIILNALIPSTAKAGNYPIEFAVNYYNGKNTEKLTALLQITCGEISTEVIGETDETMPTGTGTLALSQTSVSADIGDTVKFTAVLTNTENTNVNYKLTVLGASDWADAKIEPEDITLAPGTSIPVYVYLTPKAGTYGEQEATLSVTSGASVVASKTVTVNLPEKPSTTVKPGTGVATGLTATLGNVTLDTNTLVLIAFILALVMFGIGLALRFRAAKSNKK